MHWVKVIWAKDGDFWTTQGWEISFFQTKHWHVWTIVHPNLWALFKLSKTLLTLWCIETLITRLTQHLSPSFNKELHSFKFFFFINFALCRWQVQLRIPCHGRIKSRRHLRFSISHNGKINIGQLFENSSQMFIFLDVFNHSRMLERIYIYNLTCPTALWNLRNVLHTGVRESITREQELQEISIYDL